MVYGIKIEMKELTDIAFAELHCSSNFSFLRGASHPEELVKQAAELGYHAIAITDECSFAGIVKAHVAAKQYKIKLLIGSEINLADQLKLIVLAPTRQAYAELSSLITLARRRSPKGEYQLLLKDLEFNIKNGLVIWIPNKNKDNNIQHGSKLKEYFAQRLWLGVQFFYEPNEQQHYFDWLALAKAYDIPMVACNDVHMHTPERKILQDTLTAIRHNTPIHELGTKLQRNSERHLRPLNRLVKIYPAALLQETLYISNLCDFSLDELRYEYPTELVPKHLSPSAYLRAIVNDGAKKRWPDGILPPIQEQIEKELQLIKELAYEHYFLTVYDIVQFARSRHILCQGRGSAANSVVCYCLFITEVDPAKIDLLFERFISRERLEPPDIDVDFEHERREEVIQYIYKKYTREHAALAATVITYRTRSAIRDVGKAMGFDPLFIDQLAKSLAWWDSSGDLAKRFEEGNFANHTQLAQQFHSLIQLILRFPRHLSQHVGGFIITKNPISTLVPVENAAMQDRTIIQWDKEDIEALGLLKVDILALGMLTAIRKAIDLINSYMPVPLSMQSIPKEDPRTYDMLCRGDSVGVFQVESRAQMAMLPRLKPKIFYDLVVEVAIVRPGPIAGDMVHPYLKRRQGLEEVTYPNEAVKAVLERTLGVPIFQEQVIRLSMVAAGFSGGQADQLRRAMASWRRAGELDQFGEQLLQGMLERGHNMAFAERVFHQIQGFGEYGFPESHAASFALLVYVSAWIKCHHPAAFYCALLNSQPMGFYSPSQLVQDAKRHHVTVLPLDINYSQWDHTLEHSKSYSPCCDVQPPLRLGLRLVNGFNQLAASRIISARNQQPFRNLQDIARRARLNQGEIQSLVSANALTAFASHRHQAHWQTQAIEAARPLFEVAESIAIYNDHKSNHKKNYKSNYKNSDKFSDHLNDQVQLAPPTEIQDLKADYAAIGLTLNRHPMAILRELALFSRCKRAAELVQLNHRRFVRIAGLVTGRQRPGTATGVLFLTLEDETGNFNVVVWKYLQERCRQALLNGKLLQINGVVEREHDVIHVIAGEIFDHSQALDELAIKSRDFH